MSITTYAELQAAVASFLHRSDLASVIPDFITLAEARMSADLQTRSMDARATLTCTAGSNLVALPTDMVEMRRLLLMTEPVIVLEYRSPDQLSEELQYLAYTGRPTKFTVIGANIELSPTPDNTYSLELAYKQSIPALSNSNTTNWLLARSPAVYLYGALSQSSGYTQDDDRIPAWEQKYGAAVQALNSIDWYSGSTMRVKAR